jgi:hypothetical protein
MYNGGHMAPKKRIDVQKEIQIDMIVDGPAKGWVHTHGLSRFGRPELEIRNVPSLFTSAAGALLNEVADYMLNDTDKPVLAGQKMQIGRWTVFKFHEAKADEVAGYDENHYRAPRLRIDGVDMKCSCCQLEALQART